MTKPWYSEHIQNYEKHLFHKSVAIHADCFEWMGTVPKNSIHAIVTDPPYGVKEYDFDQLEKKDNGNGGIWRLPPSFDGHVRTPLPRFTALDNADKERIGRYFFEWGKLSIRILKPGAHLFIASNSYLSLMVFKALENAGLEYRGQIIRVVRTLRGGDRPKNAEKKYHDVSSMPRGCFEPWGLFRKPFEGTLAHCLDENMTGGLRRLDAERPFCDLIFSERTPKNERNIDDHPSLKPQSFMRQIVYASLPLGKGIIVDPFMGSGSTLAAAEATGYHAIGIERYYDYYEKSLMSIPALSKINNSKIMNSNESIYLNNEINGELF